MVLPGHGNAAPAANNEEAWPAWEPAPVQQQPEVVQVPQHPLHPQDSLDIDLSGSSMRFLRATDSNIPVDMIFVADLDETVLLQVMLPCL